MQNAASFSTPSPMKPDIDFERLMKLRLVVARFGEMDLAKWWNTKGQLGKLGSAVVRRGFPRTHYFSQARSVFAVAASRCRETFDSPDSITLWQLPEAIEDQFESHWERWLDNAETWTSVFQRLEDLSDSDLIAVLISFNLVTTKDVHLFTQLRRSTTGRAVPLPSPFTGTNQTLHCLRWALLAVSQVH